MGTVLRAYYKRQAASEQHAERATPGTVVG